MVNNIKLFFIREVQKEGLIDLKYCKSDLQLADIFTKVVPQIKFEFLREKIGVCRSLEFGATKAWSSVEIVLKLLQQCYAVI